MFLSQWRSVAYSIPRGWNVVSAWVRWGLCLCGVMGWYSEGGVGPSELARPQSTQSSVMWLMPHYSLVCQSVSWSICLSLSLFSCPPLFFSFFSPMYVCGMHMGSICMCVEAQTWSWVYYLIIIVLQFVKTGSLPELWACLFYLA